MHISQNGKISLKTGKNFKQKKSDRQNPTFNKKNQNIEKHYKHTHCGLSLGQVASKLNTWVGSS